MRLRRVRPPLTADEQTLFAKVATLARLRPHGEIQTSMLKGVGVGSLVEKGYVVYIHDGEFIKIS